MKTLKVTGAIVFLFMQIGCGTQKEAVSSSETKEQEMQSIEIPVSEEEALRNAEKKRMEQVPAFHRDGIQRLDKKEIPPKK